MVKMLEDVVSDIGSEVEDFLIESYDRLDDETNPLFAEVTITVANPTTGQSRTQTVKLNLDAPTAEEIADEAFEFDFETAEDAAAAEELAEAIAGLEAVNEVLPEYLRGYTQSDFERAIRSAEGSLAAATRDRPVAAGTDAEPFPRIWTPAESSPRLWTPDAPQPAEASPEKQGVQKLDLAGLRAVIVYGGGEQVVIDHPVTLYAHEAEGFGMTIATKTHAHGPGPKLGWQGGVVMTCIPGLNSGVPFLPEETTWVEFPPHERSYTFKKFGSTFVAKNACAVAFVENPALGRLEVVREADGNVHVMPAGATPV